MGILDFRSKSCNGFILSSIILVGSSKSRPHTNFYGTNITRGHLGRSGMYSKAIDDIVEAVKLVVSPSFQITGEELIMMFLQLLCVCLGRSVATPATRKEKLPYLSSSGPWSTEELVGPTSEWIARVKAPTNDLITRLPM